MRSTVPWGPTSSRDRAVAVLRRAWPRRLRLSRLRLRRVGFALFAIVTAAACSKRTGGDKEQADHPAVPATREASDSNLLSVAHPELFPLVAVEARVIADRLRGTCVVTPDVNRTVPVNALGGGRVVQVMARLGDAVTKGQTLVLISSPDVMSALGDYRKATADETLAKQQVERARLLFEHGTIAQKDLEAAQNVYQKSQVDVNTSGQRIAMLGGSVQAQSPYIEVKAPISGTIIEQNVTAAAGVKSPDNAPNLFTIANLSHVWVLCDVYEDELSRVQTGAIATVTLTAFPQRPFHGQITNVSTVLDSASRTAKARIELENPGRIMRQGMFATAEITSRATNTRLVVPTTAVLRQHDADWVFVKIGARAFRRTLVQAGQADASGLQVVDGGVRAGQQVVRDALPFDQALAAR